jgi:soluble lytic murein transglycosylase
MNIARALSPVHRRRKVTGCAYLLAGLSALAALLLAGYWWQIRRPEGRYDGLIRAAGSRYGVDPALVKAVVWKESRFDPNARGSSGEIGLMQIMPPAAQEWASSERLRSFQHEQLFDPEKNILAGSWYLHVQLRKYARTDNPIPYALASYNAGPGNSARWRTGAASTNSEAFIEAITFPGTKKYVRSVMNRYERYKGTKWEE